MPASETVFFQPDDIDSAPTPGKRTDRLYRRVKLDTRYQGVVRYHPQLEALVPDVREYIATWLDRQAVRRGYNVVAGRLYSPVDVPLPDDSEQDL